MNQIDYEYNAHGADQELKYKLQSLEARIGKIEKFLETLANSKQE